MSNLSSLYQETLMVHAREPRNFGELVDCSHRCHGRNPLCGDDYVLQIKIVDDKIAAVKFFGEGCAISKASASLMTSLVSEKSLAEALLLSKKFVEMLTTDDNEGNKQDWQQLPRHLQIFSGVKEFPVRVKCATLIWRTLEGLLAGEGTDFTAEQ